MRQEETSGTTGTLLQGLSASGGVARGRAVVVSCVADLDRVAAGDVLVVPAASKIWAAAFTTAGALVTETGGELARGATLAREHGIPAVVGLLAATRAILDGEQIEVDGDAGTVRRIPLPEP